MATTLHLDHINLTSEETNLLMTVEDPLAENAFPPELMRKLAYQREQDRLICVELYSSSPSYQAKAAGNPNYWSSFYVGRHNLKKPKIET